MEELGYHKATLSSTLAVVICGTGDGPNATFSHLSASISNNAANVSVCINLDLI